MIYTSETKKELDSILKAFSSFVSKHEYIDILYSDKIGYVLLSVDPRDGYEIRIGSTKKLLDVLFDELIKDVMFDHERAESSESNMAASRRLLSEILETVDGDTARYLEYLEDYLKNYTWETYE